MCSKRCSFKVVLQWNEWYTSKPVLQPDLDQLQLHEEPLVLYWPLCHHRVSLKKQTRNIKMCAKVLPAIFRNWKKPLGISTWVHKPSYRENIASLANASSSGATSTILPVSVSRAHLGSSGSYAICLKTQKIMFPLEQTQLNNTLQKDLT